MKILSTLLSVFFLCNISAVIAQDSEADYNAEYAKNIRKQRINGVYIPKDVHEACTELEALGEESGLAKFKTADENTVARKLHFGLGKWIAAKWNFYNGSRYAHYLKSMGVSYPDDMTAFTIVSFHRYLNNKPLEIEARAKAIEQKRINENLAKIEKAETIKVIKKEKPKNN